MAKRKKSTAAEAQVSAESLENQYRDYLLKHDKKPASVYAFCQATGVAEALFYDFFGSLEAIEKSIGRKHADTVVNRLLQDTDYAKFSVREKVLAFYFSLAEQLKTDRSFVVYQLKSWHVPVLAPPMFRAMRDGVKTWVEGVIAEGKQNGEIAKRPLIDQHYDQLFWSHVQFILRFWANDGSPRFEQTDVAIEKSVNLAFDLLGKGIVEQAFDFGKFLYQNSRS